ncbi:MAG: glutaredoxin [candidate division Zixibacteria bacterium]|nr:glutaredoxin [candidate division Zixibacteria bacterium]
MALWDWLRPSKKSTADVSGEGTNPSASTAKPDTPEVVVYGTSEAARCVSVRELLTRQGFVFRDIRVDDDIGTRGWLQRATGDDALPKVFVAATCYGGYEDVHVMVTDGTFRLAVEGRLAEEEDELALLKRELTTESIVELLKRGEILALDEGGTETDVWAEPYAKPPVVYYEGAAETMARLPEIAHNIVERVRIGEIEVRWKED